MGGYGTDKFNYHLYGPIYDTLMPPLRDMPITLLELGVQRGESLRLWDDYFRCGTIIGVDHGDYPRTCDGRNKVNVHVGNAEDGAFLKQVAERHGPFDIIIDDASHQGKHQLASFEALWPYVKPGGAYVVEDLTYEATPHGEDAKFSDTVNCLTSGLMQGTAKNAPTRIIIEREIAVLIK